MDAREEAGVEAPFTDAYWEQMRQETVAYFADIRQFKQMMEEVKGVQSEGRTDGQETLLEKLTRKVGQRPAYLTNVSNEWKEALRQHYGELLCSAKRCAEKVGVCHNCGSTNIVGSVGTGVSKFKSCVGCGDCGALLQWY